MMNRYNLMICIWLCFNLDSARAENLILTVSDQLWGLDTSDGDLELLGTLPVGGNEVLELARDPSGSYWGIAGGTLYSIDPFAVEAVAIGTLNTLGTIAGLAFDSTGVLFGLQWNDHLYTIDPIDASVVYRGQVDIGGPIHTLDVDSLGRLIAPTYQVFESDYFSHIDPGTLDAVLLGDAPGEISAMVFGADDVLFAYSDTTSVLYEVNLAEGSWVELYVLDSLGDVEGMELIPEPSVLTGLAVGLQCLRRRRRLHPAVCCT